MGRLPRPLVLHGSSGVPDDELRIAVRAGIVKVNVGTALNVRFIRALREALPQTGSSNPHSYLAAGRAAMADVVGELLNVVSGIRTPV